MTAVTPFLWFDNTAEEAIRFYTGLIPNSEIVSMAYYDEKLPGFAGKVMHAHFRLAGRDYYAFDAGPQFPFTEAVSLFVSCADQAEVDTYWEALTANGGTEQPCALAEGPLGSLVADRSRSAGRTHPRPRSGAVAPRGAGDAGHEEDRHRRPRGRGSGEVATRADRRAGRGHRLRRHRGHRRGPFGVRAGGAARRGAAIRLRGVAARIAQPRAERPRRLVAAGRLAGDGRLRAAMLPGRSCRCPREER